MNMSILLTSSLYLRIKNSITYKSLMVNLVLMYLLLVFSTVLSLICSTYFFPVLLITPIMQVFLILFLGITLNISIFFTYVKFTSISMVICPNECLAFFIIKVIHYIVFMVSVTVLYNISSLFIVKLFFPITCLNDYFIWSNKNPMDLRNILNLSDANSSNSSPNPGGPHGTNQGGLHTTPSSTGDNGSEQTVSSTNPEILASGSTLDPRYTTNDWIELAEKIRIGRQNTLDNRISENISSRSIYMNEISAGWLNKNDRDMLKLFAQTQGKKWNHLQILGAKIDGDKLISEIANTK